MPISRRPTRAATTQIAIRVSPCAMAIEKNIAMVTEAATAWRRRAEVRLESMPFPFRDIPHPLGLVVRDSAAYLERSYAPGEFLGTRDHNRCWMRLRRSRPTPPQQSHMMYREFSIPNAQQNPAWPVSA